MSQARSRIRRFWLPIVLGCIAIAASTAGGLVAVKSWVSTGITVVAGTAALGQLLVAAFAKQAEHRAQVVQDARTALLACLAELASEVRVPISSLGIHAYTVRRPWRSIPEHFRVARVRVGLADGIPPSTTRWTSGKGVVGRCERSAAEVWWSRRAYVNPRDPEYDATRAQKEWERLGFFDAEEWQVASRYAGIVAFPINAWHAGRRPKYVGCITLDCVEPEHWARIRKSDKRVTEILASAAAGARVAVLLI